MRRRAEILSWIGTRIGKPFGFERVMRFLLPIRKCTDIPEICLVRDGTLFVTRPGLPLGWHVAFFGSYEPELREIMRTVLPTGGVAIDVGANVGWHTLLMARLVGAHGRVLAIEANPSICEQLMRNVGLNRLAQVDLIPVAVADSETTLDFCGPSADDPASASGHVVSDAAKGMGSIRVAARPLDAIVSEKQIERLDLIKIDVEGFEWPALKGGEKTIAKFRPHILFEFDSAHVGRGGGSSSLFFEFFQRHEYRLFSVGRNWAGALDLSTWPDCANIFATPLGRRWP
jgi:FkbM family methyltransferase